MDDVVMKPIEKSMLEDIFEKIKKENPSSTLFWDHNNNI